MNNLQLNLLLEGIDMMCPVDIRWREIGISTCQVETDDRVDREMLVREVKRTLGYQHVVLL